MGHCTSDPLGYLTNSYGDDVCKYIVSIKSIQYLDQIVPKMTHNIHERFAHCSQSLNQEFDFKQQTIKDYFKDILERTLKQSRAALESVKQKEQKNEEEVFGLTKIHDRFKTLKSNKDQKIKGLQENIVRILQKKKNDMKKDIQDKCPSLPILQQMTFWMRGQVEQDGAMNFAKQIKLQEEKLLNILEKSISLDKIQDSIRREAGIEQAYELEKAAQTTFQRIKRNLTFSNNPRSCFV